jgi:hypothetical protein
MADVKSVLLTLQVDSKGAVTNLTAVRKELKKAGVDVKQFRQETKKLQQSNQNMAGSAGIAGAAVTELGRTISDLPFGIHAVTNNISQLGNMFALLVTSAKGVGNAFKAMWTTMMGPVGILLAFQAVVALIEVFADKLKSASKVEIEFSQDLKDSVDALKKAEEELTRGNKTLEERLAILEKYGVLTKGQIEDFQALGLSLEEQNDIIAQQNKLLEDQMVLEGARKIREEDIDPEKARKRILEEISDLEEEILEFEREHEVRLQVAETARRNSNYAREIAQKGYETSVKKINDEFEKRRIPLMELMTQKQRELRSTTADIAELTAEIAEQEAKISKELEARKERIEAMDELKALALEDAVERDEQEIESLAKTGDLTIKEYQRRRKEILRLQKQALKDERDAELRGVTDPKVIFAINKRYDIMRNALIRKFEKDTVDKIKDYFTGQGLETKIVGTTFELSEKAKKEAEAIMKQLGVKAVEEQLKESVSASFGEDGVSIGLGVMADAATQEAAEGGTPEGEGISPEEMLDLTMNTLNSFTEFLDADAARQIAIETNKTNAINEQLRERLRNENLTAEERKRIQAKIAANDAKLVQKQNEIEEKRFKLNKAAAIANALVSSYLAGADVLARTKADPFTRIAAMVMVITAGLATVASIAKQKFVGQTTGAGVGRTAPSGGQQGGGAPSFNVVGASELNQVAAAVAGQEKEPVRAYVVASDVSTAQEMDRNILSEASIG